MKTLSRRCKYALRALYCLSREYERAALPASSIATQHQIPRKFLEAILVQLRNSGIVESRHGKHGGYLLARRPEEITLGSVIRIIDGPLAPLPCASETAYRKCDECTDPLRCETRLVMRDVRDAVARILDQTTLDQACRRTAEASHFDYGI